MSVEQRILFEDNHLLVMNKLPGEIVQADKSGDASLSDLVSLMIKERDHKPGNVFLGVPHRLDRPASGATLFAKTGKALTRLNEMFRSREMEKKYWAITLQKPEKESMQLIHYLMRNEKQNKSYLSLLPKSGAKEAVLRYHFLCSSDKYHLLEVELFTGRHHQIRAQLATIGCVIKGDLKYGAPRSNTDGGICLHARSLSFIHPVKKERIEINAPVPQDALWQWFESQSR